MEEKASKFSHGIIQFLIVVFTISLVWFSFVYYPKALKKAGTAVLQKRPVVSTVSAISGAFPIESVWYKIDYAKESNTYYVFVRGSNLAEFVQNKNSARLALKSALGVDSLCGFQVVYSSFNNLKVPAEFGKTQNCK